MKQINQMKLNDLNKELLSVALKHGNVLVYVWIDGERYPVTSVDKGFIREGFVELNVDDTPQYTPTPEETAFMYAYQRNIGKATKDELLYYFKHKDDADDMSDCIHWWVGVEDAWLMWLDAWKFMQVEKQNDA